MSASELSELFTVVEYPRVNGWLCQNHLSSSEVM